MVNILLSQKSNKGDDILILSLFINFKFLDNKFVGQKIMGKKVIW